MAIQVSCRNFSYSPTVFSSAFVIALSLVSFSTQAQDRAVESASPADNTRVGCREHLAAENFQTAVDVASVMLTRAAITAKPSRRFDVLVCRGTANAGLEGDVAAERDFREALRLAARNFDPFDVRLVDPLTQLGRLRLNDDDPDAAELFLLRARDITHRNAGIFNVEQDKVLDDLADVFVLQDRGQQANRQQELRLRAARETYGDTPELVEALHNYASWNAEIKRFPKVRVAMEEAVSILEKNYGVNDPRLIDTLKLRSELYRQHPTISTPKAGEEAMQRVVDIYAAQEFVDQVDLLKARTDMGDWYLMGMGKTHRKGIRYYKKSVKQAIKDNVDAELIDQFYGQPVLIFFDSTRQSFYIENEAGVQLPSGKIRVRYTIGSNGIPRSIQFIENTLNNRLVTDAIYGRVFTARFRPRFVDGKAVRTPNVEQEFEILQTGTGIEIGQIYAPEIPQQ